MNALPSIFIVVLFVCFLKQSVFAQKIHTSTPFDNNLDEKYSLIGAAAKETFVYGKHAAGDYIYIYDDTLAKIKEVKLLFEKKENRLLRTLILKQQIHIFYTYNKNGASVLRLKLLDLRANEIQDQELGIFKNTYKLKRKHLLLSKNEHQLLIYAPLESNQIEILQYDLQQGRKVRQEALNLDKFNYYQNFEKIVINNQGKVFIVCNLLNSKRKRAEHHFLVFQIADSSRAQKIPFPNFVSFDFDVKYDENNQQLVVVGFYGDDLQYAKGVFYFNSTDKQIRTTALDPEFIRSLTGNKKKKVHGINHFYIRETILRRDGGILLLAEQQFTYQTSSTLEDNLENSTQADFIYENILAVSLHPTGKIFWKKVLLKSQVSSNDEAQFSSFFTFRTQQKLRIIYNNKIDWDTTIFEYLIKNDGSTKRQVLTHQSRKSGLLPQFIKSIQTTAKAFIALSYRDKDTRLVKIIY